MSMLVFSAETLDWDWNIGRLAQPSQFTYQSRSPLDQSDVAAPLASSTVAGFTPRVDGVPEDYRILFAQSSSTTDAVAFTRNLTFSRWVGWDFRLELLLCRSAARSGRLGCLMNGRNR
ncbi:hypothetical protein ONZ45_g12728 [Pleurotus djamor]|nr:hypothetical protein ONZ45_g12728 [Pleurotus djamor]